MSRHTRPCMYAAKLKWGSDGHMKEVWAEWWVCVFFQTSVGGVCESD